MTASLINHVLFSIKVQNV